MREFADLLTFAEHLVALEVGMHEVAAHAFDDALEILQHDMEDQIGHYQPQVGPYPAWPALAESTEAEKAALGAPAGAPLYRFGDLAESFRHDRDGTEGVVGSTDPVMVYHEFGTDRMPPRPVVGPALERNRERIERMIGAATVALIVDGTMISGRALGNYLGPDLKP